MSLSESRSWISNGNRSWTANVSRVHDDRVRRFNSDGRSVDERSYRCRSRKDGKESAPRISER